MTTKPNLSREAVERLADQAEAYAGVCNQTGDNDGLVFMSDTAATLRALLAAKEAAEANAQGYWKLWQDASAELTRLRAERGAAWRADRDAIVAAIPAFPELTNYLRTITPPADDAAALEALIREAKADAWDEGQKAWDSETPNPYRAKENG